jgi:hypothetical protein
MCDPSLCHGQWNNSQFSEWTSSSLFYIFAKSNDNIAQSYPILSSSVRQMLLLWKLSWYFWSPQAICISSIVNLKILSYHSSRENKRGKNVFNIGNSIWVLLFLFPSVKSHYFLYLWLKSLCLNHPFISSLEIVFLTQRGDCTKFNILVTEK